MRKLIVFESISLDGYFTGKDGDLGWAHDGPPDKEFDEFIASNASGGGVLLFGRKTYEMMVSYWPTAAARDRDPVVAEQMNQLPKIVFSRSLPEAPWTNTRLVKRDPVAEVQSLKAEAGPDLVVMGSGSIVAQLARARVIDRCQLVVKPVAIGVGRPLFERLEQSVRFSLENTRCFDNGSVFLDYALIGVASSQR